MNSVLTRVGIALVSGLAIAGPGFAQSMGEVEYLNSCAQCHGETGAGNGPVATYLTVEPPNLTTLSVNNGGVFPLSAVYASIDGSAMIGAHGREMPLWGDRYQAALANDMESAFSAEMSEAYARGRILALVEYINSLQVE